MTVFNLSVGGGGIQGAGHGQAFYPQLLPTCCQVGAPDVAHNGSRNQYFRGLNFSQEKALCCWDDAAKVVAGDKLVLFPVHAGYAGRDININNIHGLTGFQFHLEFIDLYELNKDPAAAPLFSLPVVDGSAQSFTWASVDGGDLVYGDPYGATDPDQANANATYPCKKHMVVALVIDALPTTVTPITGECVKCKQGKLGCDCGGSMLGGINLEVTLPVEQAGGLRLF